MQTNSEVELSLNNPGTRYVKFKAAGDKTTGVFVSFEQDIQGKFGPETVLTLRADDGAKVIVRCSAALARQIAANLEIFEAKKPKLFIEMTGTAPSKFGQPVKLYSVRAVAVAHNTVAAPTATPSAPAPKPVKGFGTPADTSMEALLDLDAAIAEEYAQEQFQAAALGSIK